MKIVVILDDVVVEVGEESIRDATGRFGGNDLVEPAVVQGNGNLQGLAAVAEITMAESRSEKNQAAYACLVSAREERCHEPAVTGADEDQISLAGEIFFEFGHPLFQGARIIFHEHARVPLPEEGALRTPAAAVQAVNEYARDRVHGRTSFPPCISVAFHIPA